MKTLMTAVAMVAVMAMAMSLAACKSSEEGVKTSKIQQWASVNADVEKTTAAAESVLKELELKNVKSKSTAVDGEASGEKADGTKVNVSVAKKGEGSEVTARVGTMGDNKLGAEIVSKIKAKAEGK